MTTQKPDPLDEHLSSLLRESGNEGIPGYSSGNVSARLQHHLEHGPPPDVISALEIIEATAPVPTGGDLILQTVLSTKGLWIAGGVAAGAVAAGVALSSPSEPVPASASHPGPRDTNAEEKIWKPPPVDAPEAAPSSAVVTEPAQKKTPSVETPPAPVETLASANVDEVEHLAEVRRLLHADPTQAAAMARAGHRKYPKGLLYQEREALLVLSLDRANRKTEARERGRIYLEKFPQGALSAQVRQAIEN